MTAAEPPPEVVDEISALVGGEVTLQPVGEISPWSGTWLVRCTGPSLFLKRTPRSRREPLVIDEVSRLAPELVRAVVASDLSPSSRERWFLLTDAGECDREALSLAVSTDVARLVGVLQRQCAGEERLARLLSSCPAGALRDVALGCCRWARSGEWQPEDAEFLRAAEEALVAASEPARRVAAALGRLPATIAHGDMWAGNIARSDGGFVFIDWGDAFWGVGAVDVVNLVVGRPAALDSSAEGEVWAAFEEGLGVEVEGDARQAARVAHNVSALMIDRAIAESIGKPPQWLRGIVPGLAALVPQLGEWA